MTALTDAVTDIYLKSYQNYKEKPNNLSFGLFSFFDQNLKTLFQDYAY